MTRRQLAASAIAIVCLCSAGGAFAVYAAEAPVAAPTAPTPPPSLAAHGDIADTLKASGQFTILAKALDQTNLTSVLKRPGPMTLIAPTDAAFQALPPATLESLMKPENVQQLQSLLTYHVINTAVTLTKIEGTKGDLQTASGGKVTMDATGAQIRFNDASVTATSKTTNGSIYVVDKVLMPAGATASLGAAPAG